MKHIVTITKQDFLNNDYCNRFNCPLAIALKRTFPEATSIKVGYDSFEFEHPKFGLVERDFKSCRVESCDYELHDTNNFIEDAIFELATWNEEEACDLTFNFMTP